MKKQIRKALCALLTLAMVMTSVGMVPSASQAKKKATVNKKSITVTVGKTAKITVKNKVKKATYSFTSQKKKIAKVSKKGVVKGVKAGTTKITVKQKLKKAKKATKIATVRVKVKAKKKVADTPDVTNAPVVPTAVPTKVPDTVNNATPTPVPDAPKATSTPKPTDPPINEKFTELVTKDNAAYSEKEGGLVFDNADGSLWSKQYDPVVTLPIPATLEKGFTAVVFDISCYNASGKELKYTSVWSGPITCNLINAEGDGFVPSESGSEITEGLWNYILNGVSIVSLKAATQAADFSGGTGVAKIEMKDNENISKLVVRSVRFSGYEGYDLPKETPHTEEDLEDDTPVDVTEFYDDMVAKSLMSTGNNARVKKAIAKAQAGEDVTIAYIGGSITEGEGAKPNSKCYAEVSYNAFKKKYGKGDGSNVHFVNAGMSGTPSSLGIIRYGTDVTEQAASQPDIVFIEFSVNDSGEATGGQAYESMVRDILKSGAAVVLEFAVFKSGWNMQDTYKPIGEKYGLPMVSMKDSIVPYFDKGMKRWYFNDDLHPNNDGYQLMSDCIMNLFDKIDKEEAKTDSAVIDDITPVFGDAYMGIKLLDSTVNLASLPEAITSLSVGGFDSKDTETGDYYYLDKNGSKRAKLGNNWKHTTTSGSDSFKVKVNCSNLMVVYKLSKDTTFGKAELLVDGEVVKTMDSFNSDGWNNATTELVFRNSKAETHEVEIRMAAGNENKAFTILGLGYTPTASKYVDYKPEEEELPEGAYAFVPKATDTMDSWNSQVKENSTGGVTFTLASQWNQGDIVLPETIDVSQYKSVKVECEVLSGKGAVRVINSKLLDADNKPTDLVVKYDVAETVTFDLPATGMADKIGIMATAENSQISVKRIIFLK